jgi:DNA ligase 4
LQLVKKTNALEQKWIVRIILKEMKMSLQFSSILKNFHKNALELYNSCTDLETVIKNCQNPNYIHISKVFYFII